MGTAAALSLAWPALGAPSQGKQGNPACRIVRPGDPDYEEARTDFNTRFSIFPRAILFACCARDVADAIVWARRHGVPIRARSGGHSYEAYSLVDDGLVIDVTQLDRVRVRHHDRIATVGAGAALLDVYQAMWDQAQVAFPGGSCSTVGVAGLTLGGGFGLLSRQLGLTCDALLEGEMVTADGEIVRASDRENRDLFWALRGGGGGNFGIVTELVFRVHPVTNVSLATWDGRSTSYRPPCAPGSRGRPPSIAAWCPC